MDLFAEKRILTVTQVTALIRGVLEENFEHVWVEGELSNCAVPGSGHFYCTLRDSGAQIRCVMFKASLRALKFKPRDGMRIVVRGRISVYDQRGEYQLIADYLEPQGIGALQMAFIQLKERLAAEGLFDEGHKKPLPNLPQRIGVVTSATGAAIHDILHVLDRRFSNIHVLLIPVKVQGEGAAAEIAAAIDDFNRLREVDVLIVGRGGGSMEDLWAFNEEKVARSIYRSRIPIISAVGHEVDFTIADFVADLRAPTPSAAAELVVKSKTELEFQLKALEHRLGRAMGHSLARRRAELRALGASLKDPSFLLGHASQRVDDLCQRLDGALVRNLARQRNRLLSLQTHLRLTNPAVQVERARELILSLSARGEKAILLTIERSREQSCVNAAKLHALSPLKTLARGYSIATLKDGSVVTDAARIKAADRIGVRFSRGSARCLVEEVWGEKDTRHPPEPFPRNP